MAPSTPFASALEVNEPAKALEQEKANMRVHLRLQARNADRQSVDEPDCFVTPTSAGLNWNDHEATIPLQPTRRAWSPCPSVLCATRHRHASPEAVMALRRAMSTASWAPWCMGNLEAKTSISRASFTKHCGVHVAQLDVSTNHCPSFATHSGKCPLRNDCPGPESP